MCISPPRIYHQLPCLPMTHHALAPCIKLLSHRVVVAIQSDICLLCKRKQNQKESLSGSNRVQRVFSTMILYLLSDQVVSLCIAYSAQLGGGCSMYYVAGHFLVRDLPALRSKCPFTYQRQRRKVIAYPSAASAISWRR